VQVCGEKLNLKNRHCHRLDEKLSLEQINKVPNLVWICKICDNVIHRKTLPNAEKKIIKKIQKFQLKL
jgi:rubrerythrin